MIESPEPVSTHSEPALLATNTGNPIELTELQLNGVSAESARPGEKIRVWTRLCITSDNQFFHRIVDSLDRHIRFRANQARRTVDLTRANTILLVLHPDETGELWLDSATVTLKILTKRSIEAGNLIFENDIADVTAMSFPMVEIKENDRIVCIFRVGWRFALFFDFNPQGVFSIENMERDLGTLYRRLRYQELYETIADASTFDRIIAAGWFPFVEILGSEFTLFVRYCEAGFELDEAEARLLEAFDANRIESMFTRWMAKPHFLGKERLLRSAINSFSSGDCVATIKIILTEIEGILREAHRKIHGKGLKLKGLLNFAIKSAEEKSGAPDTLFLPVAFAHYLDSHTFANFDPESSLGGANSRHAVSHGEADASSYTQVRALQAILTLDQIAFYT